MREDHDLGVSIAIGGAKAATIQWTPRDFVEALQNRMDFNRFDYEDGEPEMLVAVLSAYEGFLKAGATLDWEREFGAEELLRDFRISVQQSSELA